MLNVTECIQRLQDLFGTIAEKIAHDTQFIQRIRKITPLGWLTATVLGWLNNKNGTLETIVGHFEQQGINITPSSTTWEF